MSGQRTPSANQLKNVTRILSYISLREKRGRALIGGPATQGLVGQSCVCTFPGGGVPSWEHLVRAPIRFDAAPLIGCHGVLRTPGRTRLAESGARVHTIGPGKCRHRQEPTQPAPDVEGAGGCSGRFAGEQEPQGQRERGDSTAYIDSGHLISPFPDGRCRRPPWSRGPWGNSLGC